MIVNFIDGGKLKALDWFERYITSISKFSFKDTKKADHFWSAFAPPSGLEPETLWLTVRCSNQLS